MSVAKTMQFIKGESSGWAHETFSPLRQFAWHFVYGAFTVSVSHVAETISSIQNQIEHHRLRSFQEEYVSFLKKHGIGFEERYLWD
jgi:putative transposase